MDLEVIFIFVEFSSVKNGSHTHTHVNNIYNRAFYVIFKESHRQQLVGLQELAH